MPGNTKSPFRDCVEKIPELAKEYLESCKIDACAYSKNKGELDRVICMNLGAFAEECLVLSYRVKWRTTDFCRKFLM